MKMQLKPEVNENEIHKAMQVIVLKRPYVIIVTWNIIIK